MCCVVGNTALHLACEDDQSECALLLLNHGASLRVTNKEEHTPLDLCNPALRKKVSNLEPPAV